MERRIAVAGTCDDEELNAFLMECCRRQAQVGRPLRNTEVFGIAKETLKRENANREE